MALTLENITFTHGEANILDGISTRFAKNALTSILGPNGVGKSTLLKIMAGIIPPNHGSVLINDQPLNKITPHERGCIITWAGQQKIAHWSFKVYDIVALGRLPHGDKNPDVIKNAMEKTDCWHLNGRMFHDLSGGEQARVLLARALAGDTPFLLLDEPLSGLDPAHKLEVMEMLSALAHDKTIIIVCHDLDLAARFSKHLLVLYGGNAHANSLSDRVLEQVFDVRAERLKTIPIPWHVVK